MATVAAAIGSRGFAIFLVLFTAAAALLSGWAPIHFSIATVFLCAGPHNWIEARIFLSRMPLRWTGGVKTYFLWALIGVFFLTLYFVLMTYFGRNGFLNGPQWRSASIGWSVLLIAWVSMLVALRSKQRPGKNWQWFTPVSILWLALVWWAPHIWYVALVYIHPLMALWFFQRELRRRPQWLGVYRRYLFALPAVVGLLWWRLYDAPSLSVDDPLSLRIVQHSGAHILSGMSSHLLVATHTFLEMIHYGVWIIGMPIVSLNSPPWTLKRIPLAQPYSRWRPAVRFVLVAGLAAVAMLWAGFSINYPLTRDVYFTVAIFHILAEVPFLLRLL